jgi:radical SAM superfamily enzyme YgiQ (UPF0313 family)
MPQATAYLAANLLKHGHEVHCLDALGEGLDHIDISYAASVRYRGLSTAAIVDRITMDPDAIGITSQFSQDWPHIEAIIHAIHTKFPDTPIIVGGEHATALPEHILETCSSVSYVALGEGELTIVDFAQFLDGERDLVDVQGICYLDEDGNVHRTPPRPRLHTPDDLPWPAWELFDLEPFFKTGEGHGVERGRSMPLLATRGCPYQCTFCSNPLMWTTRYVMREPKLVVDEIEHYINRYGVQNIDFTDLTAFTKKSWILEFCNEIRNRSLDVVWQLPSGTRVEQMDEECVIAMAASGCMNMTLAPESGSERVLKEIKKRVKLSQVYETIRYAKQQGMFVKCNLIIGFPTERRRDMWKTLWIAIRFAFMGVDDTGLYIFSPYPGSELFNYLQKTGKIRDLDSSYFEGLMVFMDMGRSSEYCEHVGPRELDFYRLVGMCGFYGLSYLLHPSKILRSIRNYKSHKSDTVFEERLFALYRRYRMEKIRRNTRDSSDREAVPVLSSRESEYSQSSEVELVAVPVDLTPFALNHHQQSLESHPEPSQTSTELL